MRLTIHVPAVMILSENIIETGCDDSIILQKRVTSQSAMPGNDRAK